MEHGQATAIARGMIAKMAGPTGRYKEIEIATGLDIKSVATIVHRMLAAGSIPTPRKRGSTKTDISRQRLLDSIGEPIQYDVMARKTGMLTSSLRSLVATMRNVAELLNVKRRRGQPTNGYMEFKNGHFVGIPDEEQGRWKITAENKPEQASKPKDKGF